MTRLALIAALCLATTSVVAGEGDLIGAWEGGDHASMSIYGTMRISATHISWSNGSGKTVPRCKFRYTIEQEKAGVTFLDQQGREFVTSPTGTISTYLLKLGKGNCPGDLSYLRLTFQPDDEPDYLALVEYKTLENPMGWMHLFRYRAKPR